MRSTAWQDAAEANTFVRVSVGSRRRWEEMKVPPPRDGDSMASIPRPVIACRARPSRIRHGLAASRGATNCLIFGDGGDCDEGGKNE